jgi:hypothetical protein
MGKDVEIISLKMIPRSTIMEHGNFNFFNGPKVHMEVWLSL